MSEPFVGQITCYGHTFAPRGWAQCKGQLLPISQNTALFSLLGTQFGGNGTSNFGLPNLQGNVPIGQGSGAGLTPRVMGETAGEVNVTLTSATTPAHNHAFVAANAAGTGMSAGAGQMLAQGNIPGTGKGGGGATVIPNFAPTAAPAPLASLALSPFQGGSQPHNNVQPSLSLNWCIALQGVFPARN